MKVRCAKLGNQGLIDRRLTIGSEYLVLGLSFEFYPDHLTASQYVHILLEYGGVASCDLDLFETTDPRCSRYWHIRTTQFDNRQCIDFLPPSLLAVLNIADDDERTGEELDKLYFEALGSTEFKHICTLLRDEYLSDYAAS